MLVLRSTGHFHLLVDRWLQYFLNVMEPSAHSTGCAYMDMHLCIHCVFSDSTGQSVCVHVLCAHVPTICFIYVQCSRSFFFFFKLGPYYMGHLVVFGYMRVQVHTDM